MNCKKFSRFKWVWVFFAILLMAFPVGSVSANGKHFDGDHGTNNKNKNFNWGHGDNYSDLIVDPILTDDGYVSGTMIDVAQRCWIYIPCLLTGETECTECSDTLLGEPGEAVRVYRGIPYAAPPVGDLRWKPPQPVTPWEGILEATKFTPMAPQTYRPNPFWGGISESGISEDCLYLNVATPAKHKHERLPVLVWFHGGGITTGTSSPSNVYEYMGAEGGMLTSPLPSHGIVLVTVQHRIGPFGYMALPELTAESPNNASGNYGQLDLIAALKWVKRNIAAFGGDPHNVTIFGQSGGGSKTLWMLSSPLAKGLFQKALVEAGCAINAPFNPMSMCKTQADAEANGLLLQASAGVSSLSEMRALKWQDIIDAVPVSGYVDTFTIDGYSLKDSIYYTFKSREQNDVPFVIGAAEGEPLKHRGIQLWADALLSGKSNVYVYLMAQVPSNWKNEGLVAWHGSDVAYEFGDVTALNLFPGALIPANVNPDPGVTSEDYAVAEYMMSMLAQFTRTGDPSLRGVRWPAFSLEKGHDWYIDIEYPVQAKTGYMSLFPQ